jgi:hypothetical protein
LDLEPVNKSVTLPVRQIIDSNLAWVRQDVGPLDDELQAHMKRHGLLLPVLLTKDMVVADGARRIVRAQRLGWKTIPVRVTSDWDVVNAHFARQRELAAAGVPTQPMTWEETLELAAGPMDELYARRRLERNRQTRLQNRERQRAGEPMLKVDSRKNDFMYDVGVALGWVPSDLRTVREIHAAIRVFEDGGGDKELAEALRQEVRDFEQSGGAGVGLYALLRRTRATLAGKDMSKFRIGRAKRKIGEPTMAERQAKAAVVAATANGRELDTQTIKKLTAVLTGLGIEANAYTHLRPSVMADDAAQAAKDLKVAVVSLNRLIRVMKAYAESLEERAE